MKSRQYYHKISLLFFIGILSIHTLMGSDWRQYNSRNGLTTSTVSTVFQDHDGLIWLGTNDGLSTFDGKAIRKFGSGNIPDPFAGSTVVNIFETVQNNLWVLSDKGLYCLDRSTLVVDIFPGFNSDTHITCGSLGYIYAVNQDNFLSWYHPEEEQFRKIPVRNLKADSVLEIFTDNENNLWIFTDDGNHRSFSISTEQDELRLTPFNNFSHAESLLWCFYEDGSVYFVDATLTFFAYHLNDRTKHYIQDIRQEVLKYGEISSIIRHRNDFFIGFAQGGLIRIKSVPDQRSRHEIEELPVDARILSLATDKFQDILWIGTSDDGVYMYFNEYSSLNTVLSSSLSESFQSPITSIYMDAHKTLWLASGNDGVISIPEYDPVNQTEHEAVKYSIHNSLLGSNTAYAFAPSVRNILWIGTENGINYYSYSERRIKNLQLVADGKPLKFVRSVCEVNDTTLWIGTAGEGLVKARVAGTEDNPIITTVNRIMVADGSPSKNNFTNAYHEDDNTVWFGSQGEGAWKVDSYGEKIENIRPGNGDNILLNTIYSIYKNARGYWFGTADGLVNLKDGRQTLFNENNGLPCKLVMGILEDNSDNLWLSTDRGISRFNLERHIPHLYKQNQDKTVGQLLPGSYFKDSSGHLLLFGGVDGFVTVNENDFIHPDFIPDIRFTGLSIFGKEKNINEYISTSRNTKSVRLSAEQNVFAISFVAYDYIDGADYSYFYRLDEQSNEWINNGHSNVALFTYLSPGIHKLSIRYRNNITGKESPVSSLRIHIAAPWYQSWWALMGYLLMFSIAVYIARLIVRWQNHKTEEIITARLNRKFMNEANKHKLRFFSFISNEIYSMLALVQNPARKIQALPDISNEVNINADIIIRNTRYLEDFLRDMIELKMLETGERKPLVQTLPVSELADFITESYLDKAALKQAGYTIRIDSGIYWNTDSYCIRSIINTLLSYVFAYINPGGNVSIFIAVKGTHLQMIIAGSKMESGQEHIIEQLIRHTVVEAIEAQASEGQPVHEQLTLGICHNMVKLIGGKVEAATGDDNGVVFTVNLPQLQIEDEETPVAEDERPLLRYTRVDLPVIPELEIHPSCLTILVLTNHFYLRWLMAEQLYPRYNVVFLTDNSRLSDILRENRIGLILSEVNLSGGDGIEIFRQIKGDSNTSLIPFVLLASANTPAEKQRALQAGVEYYISKPFDMDFIEKEIDGILQYKELQYFYTTALIRTFELGDEHFVGEDDKTFYEKMLNIIDRNLNNPLLSAELICTELDCTSQEFYSRLKTITRKTPNEIIREYRLNTVELLLVSTTLPVEEIIDKAGFVNRGNFFKIFSQKYGMTPRNYRSQHSRKIREAMGK